MCQSGSGKDHEASAYTKNDKQLRGTEKGRNQQCIVSQQQGRKLRQQDSHTPGTQFFHVGSIDIWGQVIFDVRCTMLPCALQFTEQHPGHCTGYSSGILPPFCDNRKISQYFPMSSLESKMTPVTKTEWKADGTGELFFLTTKTSRRKNGFEDLGMGEINISAFSIWANIHGSGRFCTRQERTAINSPTSLNPV